MTDRRSRPPVGTGERPTTDAGQARVEAERSATPRQPDSSLTVTVPGVPAPQGSLKSLGAGRPSVHANAATLLPWRASVVAHVRQQMERGGDWPITGPVALSVTFRMPRPKSAPKSRLWPDRKPDLDKLLRACGDCLGSRTGAGVIHDDAQVVSIQAAKEYGAPGMTLTLPALAGGGS